MRLHVLGQMGDYEDSPSREKIVRRKPRRSYQEAQKRGSKRRKK